MSSPHLVEVFLAEIEELCSPHDVYRQGDCITVHNREYPDVLSGTIYPYTDMVILHCHNHLLGRRLYLVADPQHPTEVETTLDLLRRHINNQLTDSDYNGR